MEGRRFKKNNRILKVLGLLGNFLKDARDPFGLISIPYKEVYGFIPGEIGRNAFSSSISYGTKVGDIEKVFKNNEVYLKITKQGLRKFSDYFPLTYFERKPWDKKWRVLIYDIPENYRSKRNALRVKVKLLGFGKLQESVYISPFPIEKEMEEFLETQHLKEFVLFLLSDKIFAGGEKYLAESVWQLSKLNNEYKLILEKIELTNKWTEEKIKEVKALFLDVLSSDPFLPKELLTGDWLRDKVKEKIRKLSG